MFDIIKGAFLIRIYKRHSDYVSTFHTEVPIPYIPQQPVFVSFFNDNDNTLFMQDPIYFFLFDLYDNDLMLTGPLVPKLSLGQAFNITLLAQSNTQTEPLHVTFELRFISSTSFKPY